jgi:hypothetical protein
MPHWVQNWCAMTCELNLYVLSASLPLTRVKSLSGTECITALSRRHREQLHWKGLRAASGL